MDLLGIALIIVAIWIGLLVVVVAMCKASARADADEERHLAEGREDMWNQSLAPHSNVAIGDARRSTDAAELEREAKRLGIELPKRRRLHLPHLVGTHRHRS